MARTPDPIGADAPETPAAEPAMTREEFLAYVNEELKPMADVFGLTLKVYDTPVVLDPVMWPTWKYHPETRVGAIYQRPEDVPPGFLDSPFDQ